MESTSTIVPAITRPVGVVIEQTDPDEWYVYISDANDVEVCGFGDASRPLNKEQAHEAVKAINAYPDAIATLAAILPHFIHQVIARDGNIERFRKEISMARALVAGRAGVGDE